MKKAGKVASVLVLLWTVALGVAQAQQEVRIVFATQVDGVADTARLAFAHSFFAQVRERIGSVRGLALLNPWEGREGLASTFDRRRGRFSPPLADSLALECAITAVLDFRITFRDSLLRYDCAAVELGSGITVGREVGDLALADGYKGSLEPLDEALARLSARLLSEGTPCGYPFAEEEVGLLFLVSDSTNHWHALAEATESRLAELGLENARLKTVRQGDPWLEQEAARAAQLVRSHLAIDCSQAAGPVLLATTPPAVSAAKVRIPLLPATGPCVRVQLENGGESAAGEGAALFAVRALYAAGRHAEAVALATAWLKAPSGPAAGRLWLQLVRAQANHALVRSGNVRGERAAQALDDYAACLAVSNTADDSLAVPYLLFNIADLHRLRGEVDKAVAECGQAASGFAAQNAWREEILAYKAREELHRSQGAWSAARAMCNRVVAIAQGTGDALTMGEACESLGMLLEVEGQADSALQAYRRGLEVYRLVGNPYGVAELEGRIGAAFRRVGEADSARCHFARQIALAQELRSEPLLAKGHFHLGLLLRADNRLDSALVHFQASLEQMRLMGDMPGMARALNNLGSIYHEQGDSARAARFYGESLRAAEELGDNVLTTRVLLNLGDLCRDGQNFAQAAEGYNRALNSAKSNGDVHGEALSLFALGLLRLKSGKISDGYALLERAVRLGESVEPQEFAPQREFLRRLRQIISGEP
ncbi:MAG: tetratricopeptide repeat protein [bacterium]|nr:tetratricopeptide repeat protein [bacterium]